MDFKTLQDEVADILNFTPDATDQDFTSLQVKKAINQAYADEVVKAKQCGSRVHFTKFDQITWPASQRVLTFPQDLQQKDLISFTDVTNDDPGHSLPGSVFWKDNKTLQWGTSGPASARTIRVYYYAAAETLVNDGDIPELIQPEHHELLMWSAAIRLRLRSDEGAPGPWTQHHRELQLDYWKSTSRGKPPQGFTTVQRDQTFARERQGSGNTISQDNDS